MVNPSLKCFNCSPTCIDVRYLLLCQSPQVAFVTSGERNKYVLLQEDLFC